MHTSTKTMESLASKPNKVNPKKEKKNPRSYASQQLLPSDYH